MTLAMRIPKELSTRVPAEQWGTGLDRTQAAVAAIGPQPAPATRPGATLRAAAELAVRGPLAAGGPMTLAVRVPEELSAQVPAEQCGPRLDRPRTAAAALGPQPAPARRPRASSGAPSLREGL
jgi:hypothetical protein